ncbi:MAG: hypothetical protein FE78DRAFT_290722 [Acidomyces sp. 'richmondensis']|nr:MAG: hypothetical protein FE78DRAFT_290722 [Acidomyces sp. 'richmondensis']
MVGSDTCVWECFVDAASFIVDHSLTALMNADPAPVLRLARMASSRARSMLELASKEKRSQATTPRDKIYSLLGIGTDGDSVIPDCNTPTTTVYCDFALSLIKCTAALDVLNMVDHFSNYSFDQADFIVSLLGVQIGIKQVLLSLFRRVRVSPPMRYIPNRSFKPKVSW